MSAIELHLSRREYGHVLAVLEECTDAYGRLNDADALMVLRSYYGVQAFTDYRIVVHPEVPDDYRLSLVVRPGVSEDLESLARKLYFSEAYKGEKMDYDLGKQIMPFGKYKGTMVKDLPDDYLSKLLDGDTIHDENLMYILVEEWKKRSPKKKETDNV